MNHSHLETKILMTLHKNPSASQRELASRNGISLGKANYVVNALIEKGYVKVKNFSKSKNKRKYIYNLTPMGIIVKTRQTQDFLRSKLKEYESLTKEIGELKEELLDDRCT